jgi:hypothetical protein
LSIILRIRKDKTYANAEMCQILQLGDKDYKAAVIKMICPLVMNTLKINEKNLSK